MRKFIFGSTIFVSAVLLCAAFFFTGVTLTDGRTLWAIFIGTALLAAAATWKRWRRLTGSGRFIWNFLFSAAVSAAVLSSSFFISNYSFSRDGSRHTVTAEVVGKYTREQAKRRTVGRRSLYTGEKTHTYHIVLRFGNGLEKDSPVAVKEYLKIRIGDKMNYSVATGLFGIPVIKPFKE